jgi:hypothetical protein
MAVSRSGYGCEYMGWLNLVQEKIVMVWTGCIWVSIWVRIYGLAESRSE